MPRQVLDAIGSELSGIRHGAVVELGRLLLRSKEEKVLAAARRALRDLAADDSRLVSDAAQKALGLSQGC